MDTNNLTSEAQNEREYKWAWLSCDLTWKAEMLYNNNFIYTEQQWEEFCEKMEDHAQALLIELDPDTAP